MAGHDATRRDFSPRNPIPPTSQEANKSASRDLKQRQLQRGLDLVITVNIVTLL